MSKENFADIKIEISIDIKHDIDFVDLKRLTFHIQILPRQ